ncbi:zinc metalloprotease [Nocardiopsis sp. CNT-189]|uniref:zinc metalloprotease n=1 Tax=Nocardiopsis oceanisediminis TaxID=2816862 RepID=UPI003B2971D7
MGKGTAWRIWSGTGACAAALAGLLAAGASSAEDSPERPPAAAAGECAPGAERRTDPGTVRDRHGISPAEAAEYERKLREARVSHRGDGPVTVPVAMHVITAADGTGDVPDDKVREQIDVMNRGFGGGYAGVDTGFRFELREVTRTGDDAWFGSFEANESKAKAELRRGGPETLNIYTVDMGSGVLGQSTFPQDYRTDPKADGVVVDYRTVPGGGRKGFDLGHTATHETGHWLGLFHTFQNGCSHPGDYVEDTPYEREQSSGCPKGRDTCPDKPGTDPVRNFMNYSDDPCLREFTRGQAVRMSDHWHAFRDRQGNPAR